MPRLHKMSEDWNFPTAQTLKQYDHGLKHGLVPAGHRVLHIPAREVPQHNVPGKKVDWILARMHRVITEMQKVGRPILGLAAPQIGTDLRVIFVQRGDQPKDATFGDFMPVINPRVTRISKLALVSQGCFSSNEVFARIPSAHALVLTGYSRFGEHMRLERNGRDAVVDQHACWHLQGTRAADVAVGKGIQLDWRPPERAQEYRDFIASTEKSRRRIEWTFPYPAEQWAAVKDGGFKLEAFN